VAWSAVHVPLTLTLSPIGGEGKNQITLYFIGIWQI
jgi:hypothetical protein